jgi:alkanesulfonate monooxygenase SsuD/methylene tetrahydromethanopterin reductase-like flavin-dependent oxidoreductase (luciferase family)
MKFGIILPGGTAMRQLEQAVRAEEAGWDGVFTWEAAYGVDAWSLLAAMAARTNRVRLGTVLSPLPWRRPWKLASQIATLDQLSAGRAIVTVGLGAIDSGMADVGEVTDRRERAARLDEGIDLMRTLWAGRPDYAGEHFRIHCPDWLLEAARPVQQRIPVWVAAAWPRPKSMTRVLRCDGVLPEWHLDSREGGPDDIRELRGWLTERGARADLDVIAEGETPAAEPAAAASQVAPWAAAGCTWWLETRWGSEGSVDQRLGDVDARIAAGPPPLTAPGAPRG